MGMFDYLECQLPLPDTDETLTFDFQTKSLDCWLDNYQIRSDGTLWHETYDIEDRSDPNATGIYRMVGSATRVNRRWEQLAYTGEVEFYGRVDDIWYSYSAYFVRGYLKELHRLEDS